MRNDPKGSIDVRTDGRAIVFEVEDLAPADVEKYAPPPTATKATVRLYYRSNPEEEPGEFWEREAGRMTDWTDRLAGARGGFVQLMLEPSRWLGKASVRRRDVPVTYRHAREVRFRARVGGLSGAVALPNPISRNVGGLAIEASVQQDGAAVSAEGVVTLSKTRFPPGEFRSLRRGYAAMRSLASMGFRAP